MCIHGNMQCALHAAMSCTCACLPASSNWLEVASWQGADLSAGGPGSTAAAPAQAALQVHACGRAVAPVRVCAQPGLCAVLRPLQHDHAISPALCGPVSSGRQLQMSGHLVWRACGAASWRAWQPWSPEHLSWLLQGSTELLLLLLQRLICPGTRCQGTMLSRGSTAGLRAAGKVRHSPRQAGCAPGWLVRTPWAEPAGLQHAQVAAAAPVPEASMHPASHNSRC